MLLKTLHMKNWCQHRDVSVTFRPGINGILGSNGKGKSNTLKALRFVLIGTTDKADTKTDNLTWGQTKGHVQLDFEAGSVSDYELRRSIESGKVTLHWANGREKISGAKEVAAELVKLLGATARTLDDNVFIPQGKINEILEMAASERVKEFQQTFGLARAEQAYELLGKEVSSYTVDTNLPAALAELVALVVANRATVATQEATVEELQKICDGLAPAQQVINRAIEAERANRTLAEADVNLAAAKADYAAKASACSSAQHQADLAEQTKNEIAPQVPMAQSLVQAAGVAAQLAASNAAARANVATLKAQLTGAQPTAEAIEAARQAVTAAAASVDRFNGMLRDPSTRPKLPAEITLTEQLQQAKIAEAAATNPPPKSVELLAVEADGNRLTAEIASLGTGICKSCGQEVKGGPALAKAKQVELEAVRAKWTELHTAAAQSHALVVAQRRDEVNAITTELVGMQNAAIAAVRGALATAEATRAPAAAALAAILALNASWQAYTNALATVREDGVAPDPEAVRSAQEVLTRFEMSRQALSDATSKLSAAKAILGAANDAVARATQFKTSIVVVQDAPTADQVAVAQADLATLSTRRVELADATKTLGTLKAVLDQRERDAVRLRDQVRREEVEAGWVAEVKAAREALHYTQLPTSLMREYARLINERMAFYLSMWETTWKFLLDDNLAFKAVFANGECSGSRLSGGQQVVASASFRLAMSDTFAKEVGLLIFDEPSNHLDKENIEHLKRLLLKLKELSAHTGRQMLVVTHEASLTGFFDHVVEI